MVEKDNKLQLIPKTEKYIEYILNIIQKMPRTEKFNIGNEYKNSMYNMIRNILYLSKISDKRKCLEIVNLVDAELNVQRIYLRIMQKQSWIDNNKFNVSIKLIYEIGKIIGGLTKFYAKDT